MYKPLAQVLRPQTLNDVVGQKHLLGENGILKNIIDSGRILNMIFYGPSGVGKTTVASIIANYTDKKLYRLNATTASIQDIKQIISELDTIMTLNGVIIYIDEIQYFNKKQQQTLLEFIEDGRIILIASTNENPYFCIYNAILSRCAVFEFKYIESNDIKRAIKRAFSTVYDKYSISEEIIDAISFNCGGDLRKAINTLEILINSIDMGANISKDNVKELLKNSNIRYDKNGDMHYDILSAFQKSIRGSDVDATLHYLARLIKVGDIVSISRRLLVIASEDIGLAYPQAISIVKSCVDSAFQLGLPEARIPLAQAAIVLATSPKSNSVLEAIDKAIEDVTNGNIGDIPLHLKDCHYSGAKKIKRGITYKYPHDYKNHWVEQQYLPDEIKNVQYYTYADNKNEQIAYNYWRKLKALYE